MAALVKILSSGILTSASQRYRQIIPNAIITRMKHSEIEEHHENYDIIITGGGLIGTTLACAIANNRKLQSKKILLLEASSQHYYQPGDKYSNRVIAVNPQSRNLLSSIGAWRHIEAVRFCPVKKIQVWDACSDAMITFNDDNFSVDLAYIIENDLILSAVNKELSEKSNVNVIHNAKIKTINLPRTTEEQVEIILHNGEIYKAQLLVGADGINSQVRKAMCVQYVSWDYGQMGIVANLELSEPTENVVAWQRFLPTGPIALLPLRDNLSALVWSIQTEDAKRLLKLSEEEFVDSVNNALWKIYEKNGVVENCMKTLDQLLQMVSLQSGRVQQLQPSVTRIEENSRAAFPLGFGHSVHYVKSGVVLVGDAAHRVHPLAGLGVNLGFGDITILVQTLSNAVANGALLGDTMYLRKYETARQCHNVPTMFAIEALHRLYKGTASPMIFARSLGLQLTNALPILKKSIIQHASERAIIY